MKRAHKASSFWTRGHFLSMVGALFVLQAGLLFLFGNRSRTPPPLSSNMVIFRSLGASANEDQLMREFFVGDPAVFPWPNRHGFSGRGWMDERPPEFQSEHQLEPPDFLALDTTRLGTNFPVFPSNSEAMLSETVEQPSRHEEPPPSFLAPEIIATQSIFVMVGPLADRLLGGTPTLTNWPSAQLLTNSTVQIAVDAAGEVMATRLRVRCGSDEADTDAMAKARAFRFRPSPGSGTRWGEAVFHWQTVEPVTAPPAK